LHVPDPRGRKSAPGRRVAVFLAVAYQEIIPTTIIAEKNANHLFAFFCRVHASRGRDPVRCVSFSDRAFAYPHKAVIRLRLFDTRHSAPALTVANRAIEIVHTSDTGMA